MFIVPCKNPFKIACGDGIFAIQPKLKSPADGRGAQKKDVLLGMTRTSPQERRNILEFISVLLFCTEDSISRITKSWADIGFFIELTI